VLAIDQLWARRKVPAHRPDRLTRRAQDGRFYKTVGSISTPPSHVEQGTLNGNLADAGPCPRRSVPYAPPGEDSLRGALSGTLSPPASARYRTSGSGTASDSIRPDRRDDQIGGDACRGNSRSVHVQKVGEPGTGDDGPCRIGP